MEGEEGGGDERNKRAVNAAKAKRKPTSVNFLTSDLIIAPHPDGRS